MSLLSFRIADVYEKNIAKRLKESGVPNAYDIDERIAELDRFGMNLLSDHVIISTEILAAIYFQSILLGTSFEELIKQRLPRRFLSPFHLFFWLPLLPNLRVVWATYDERELYFRSPTRSQYDVPENPSDEQTGVTEIRVYERAPYGQPPREDLCQRYRIAEVLTFFFPPTENNIWSNYVWEKPKPRSDDKK